MSGCPWFVHLTDPATDGLIAIRIDRIAAVVPFPMTGTETADTTLVVLIGAENGVMVSERPGLVLDAIADAYRLAAEATS